MVYRSIWQDTYYTTTKSPFNYTIRLDGNVIFAGRAYAYPNSDMTKVKINSICENYLSQKELNESDIPSDPSEPREDFITDNPNVVRDFQLYDEDISGGTLIETYEFLDCWDYDYELRSWAQRVLSDPIDNAVTPWEAQFETSLWARLTDSEGKTVFAINTDKIKEYAAVGDPYKQVVFELVSLGSQYEMAARFYYTPETDYLSFGTTSGSVEYQYGVSTIGQNWTNPSEYPMALNLHARRFDNMLYFYSDNEYDEGRLSWTTSATTNREYVYPTFGLEITTGSSYYSLTIPHSFVAKTMIWLVDDGDPNALNCCVKYALHYVNAKGGWDSFLIQGAGLKKENLTVYTTDRAYDNTTMEFEQMRNVTDIQTIYELNTHYLTDEQSEKLVKNLLGSNMVYLQEFPGGRIFPVIIQDHNLTYQTYQTNGKRLAQYKIKVAESQTKHRRH